MEDVSNVTLAVLAGGEGSRMGTPKANLSVGDRSILRWLLDRWQWSGPTLLVTTPGREKPPGSEQFDREVTDTVAGEGPLRGLATALAAVRTPIIVVATCDMPHMENRQFCWLADALIARRATSWMVMTRSPVTGGEITGGEIEPFPCAIQRTARKAIESHLASGARSLHSLASLAGVEVIPAPDEWPASAWTNLNTREDYDRFIKEPDGTPANAPREKND
ncbi:MAG: molybdenum cofactor guanylyltransferase [Tepidisphaeraceae bacterium]